MFIRKSTFWVFFIMNVSDEPVAMQQDNGTITFTQTLAIPCIVLLIVIVVFNNSMILLIVRKLQHVISISINAAQCLQMKALAVTDLTVAFVSDVFNAWIFGNIMCKITGICDHHFVYDTLYSEFIKCRQVHSDFLSTEVFQYHYHLKNSRIHCSILSAFNDLGELHGFSHSIHPHCLPVSTTNITEPRLSHSVHHHCHSLVSSLPFSFKLLFHQCSCPS